MSRLSEDIDYDAMLANGRQGKHGDSALESPDDASGDSDGPDDPEADDPDPDSQSGSEDEERELLPTEDDFLRLDDMEKFVQVCA